MMKRVLHPKNHKSILVLLLALASFAGFEALALTLRYYQIGVFWHLAAYLYVFLLFWVSFSHDTHRRHVVRAAPATHDLINYLILPSIVYWAVVALLFLNPFARSLQFVWILMGVAGLAGSLWYLKSVFRSHRKAPPATAQVIFLVQILASYLAMTAALGIGHYMGYGGTWTAFLVFFIVIVLMRQALFQHHEITSHTLTVVFAAAVIIALCAYFIYGLWSVNFYSAGLVLAVIYNTLWGFIHHEYIDRNLTRKIVYEYLAVLFVVLVILLSTTNFAQRI